MQGLLSPTPTAARQRRFGSRRAWLIGSALVLLILLIIKPPFVLRPLPGRTVPGAVAQPIEDPAAAYVNPIWSARVLPTIEEKAQDIATLLPAIRADPESAGQKYGRRESTNPYSYMVKGTGKVSEVHTQSQAGTALLEIPGLDEKVALQVGPVVRGSALRDATGLVTFNQFTNQLAYADVSKEMNGRALKAVAASVDAQSFPVPDKTVTFFGAFTFDPRSKNPVLITPTKVLVVPAANP